MTAQEARKHFGLKETDPIYEPGVREILRIAEINVKAWRLQSEVDKARKEIEACKALLEA